MGLPKIEQQRPGIVQQGEDSQRAIGGDEVEIGHATPDERMSLAEVVMVSRPDIIPANRLRGSSMPRSSVTVSRNALVRSSARRSSATCAIVLRNARAATGCRSA
jgi:hypothetical protein